MSNLRPPIHRSVPTKPADRDSFYSTYNKPDFSLSFQYPRTFSLTEDRDDFGVNSSLKSQSQLDPDQSGLTLLASIEVPDDAYPNTTFVSGHLQFAVNPTLTGPACLALAALEDPEKTDPTIHESVGVEGTHGIVFNWRQSHSVLNHMDYLSRDYFAFSNNTCYEFFLQVSATIPPDPTPGMATSAVSTLSQSGSVPAPAPLAP